MVRVAVRDPEAALFLKPMGRVGQVVPLFADMARPAHPGPRHRWARIVVINLVGILAERRRGDFRPACRHEGAGAGGAEAARGRRGGVWCRCPPSAQMPHSPAAYGRTKAAGEAGRARRFPKAATILRPSIVFGPEDQFFNRFAALAQISPGSCR